MGKLMEVSAPPRPSTRSQFGDFAELVKEILDAPLEGEALVKVWDDLTPSAAQTLADGLRGEVFWETTEDKVNSTPDAARRIMWARPFHPGEQEEIAAKAKARAEKRAAKAAEQPEA